MNPLSFTAPLTVAFTGAVMFLLPHLSPRRYFFAITVAPGFPSSEGGRTILRAYHVAVLISVLLSAAVVFALAGVIPNLAFLASVLLPLAGGGAAFLWARSKARAHSFESPQPERAAGLSPEADRLPRWMALALLPFAAPLAAAAWLRSHWDEIPARFPVHFDANGAPNRWAEKSARAVFGPLLAEAGLMLAILFLSIAMFHGARRGPQRIAVLKMLVAVLYLLGYTFTLTSLTPLARIPVLAILLPALVFSVGVLVWCFRMASNPEMPAEDTPDRYWRLGAIYANRSDPAIFVQKRIGFGYTFNFGNPLSWAILGLFALVVIAFVLLAP